GGGGLVDAVWELGHDVAALRFGLVEDAVYSRKDGVATVFVEQLVHAPRGQPTGGHLRFHVAERGLRKADVVLEHAWKGLVELALLIDLELIELQPFEPRVGYARTRAKTG